MFPALALFDQFGPRRSQFGAHAFQRMDILGPAHLQGLVLGGRQAQRVALAAVIGVAHPKWDERPILLIQRHAEATCGRTELLAFLDGKIARWWMPDDVVVVDEIPLGATGKIDKKLLRQRMAGYVLPDLATS